LGRICQERGKLAEPCDLLDLRLDELVAHHAADAGVANRRELLGRLLDRPDDPALGWIAQKGARVLTGRVGDPPGAGLDLARISA
jgi:hypothetical protein